LLRDELGGRPDFWLSGIRHGGGVISVQARVRNLGTCRPDAKGEVQVGSPHEDERTEAGHRGGAVRSSVDRRPSLSHDRNIPIALIYLANSLHEVAFYRRRWRATLKALFLEKSVV